MYSGLPTSNDVDKVRDQIAELKASYRSQGSGARGVTLEEVNQTFTAAQIDQLADELLANLEVALWLIELSEHLRYKS